MFSKVLEIFPLLLSISFVLCENTKTSSFTPTTSSKTVSGISIAPTAFTGNKSAQFVKIIKNDLLKNNDDYLEPVRINISNPYLSTNKQPIKNTVTKAQTTKTNVADKFPHKTKNATHKNNIEFEMKRKQFKSIDNIRRSGLKVPLQRFTGYKNSTINKIIVYTNKSSAPQRNWNLAKNTTSLRVIDKHKLQEAYPKYVNKEKVVKVDEARKMGLKDFLMKKPGMRNSKGKLRISSSREQELVEIKAREATEIPTGDQLDMAPGKGGRMHAKRLKNYLCHRHVMMPEGPKYDSQGKIYLPAYREIYGRKYDQTRRPIFLLPKCCNCCKKSILGCA